MVRRSVHILKIVVFMDTEKTTNLKIISMLLPLTAVTDELKVQLHEIKCGTVILFCKNC